MEIDFEYLGAGTTAWVPLAGERSSTNSTYFCYWVNATSLKAGVNYAGWDTAGVGFPTLLTNIRYVFNNNSGNFYINDIATPSTTNTLVTGTTSIYIFTIGSGSGIDNRQAYLKVYSFILNENDVLVRNMIPAVRNSDYAVVMYDTINNTFYTNAGSGTFSYG